MKPQKYINKLGLEYFKVLSGILKKRGMDSQEYSIELTILANEYANYEEAQIECNKKGAYVVYSSGAQQIAPWVTYKEKSISNILKLSPKFGLNPKDMEAIREFIQEEKEDKLGNLLN